MSVPHMNPEAPSFYGPESHEYAEMHFTPIDGSTDQSNSGTVSMQALFNGIDQEPNDSMEHRNDMTEMTEITKWDFEYMRSQLRSILEENARLLAANAMLKQQFSIEMQSAAVQFNVLMQQREEALEVGGLLQKAVLDLSFFHMDECPNFIGSCVHLQDSVNDKPFTQLRYCCHFAHLTPFWTTIADIVQGCVDTRLTPWVPLRYTPVKAWKDIDLIRQRQRLSKADADLHASTQNSQVQYTPPPTPASNGDVGYPELMPQYGFPMMRDE